MINQVKILSGVSGCGKSTIAREYASLSEDCRVISADNFFMHGGEYKFNPSQLSLAHGQCFREFILAIQAQIDLVIVDNTNTTAEEISPYVLGATAFGYEPEIITIMPNNMTDIEKCAERNKHDVPLKVISAQYKRICNRQLPPYWKASIIPAKF